MLLMFGCQTSDTRHQSADCQELAVTDKVNESCSQKLFREQTKHLASASTYNKTKQEKAS